MGGHLGNQLLARLDPATFASVKPYLTAVRLSRGDVIAETHAHVQKVYFPHGGIISCVVVLGSGGEIETGMIGNDGQYGAGAALDHKISLNHVVMQIVGSASVLDADRLCDLAQENPRFRQMLMHYEQFFLAQVQQTAACNAAHDVESRTCKWLLRMQKLVGNELSLTQEFLAQMMGVRRTSVTEVAGELQKAGMISYTRGHVQILDLVKIQERACECDAAVNSHHARIFD
jgi:CRP-like cAMP-binding protein